MQETKKRPLSSYWLPIKAEAPRDKWLKAASLGRATEPRLRADFIAAVREAAEAAFPLVAAELREIADDIERGDLLRVQDSAIHQTRLRLKFFRAHVARLEKELVELRLWRNRRKN